MWFLPWSVRVEGALASGLELGRLCQFWPSGLERITRLCYLYIPKSDLSVPCSLSTGAPRLAGMELLVFLGEKGPGILSSIDICLQLGLGLSTS